MQDNSPSASLRALVVDDWPIVADTLAGLLRLWGHDVRTAFDGADGLAAALVYHPDVILLDASLPEMDGYEVARRLRRCPQLERSFIVSMSGHGGEEEEERSRDAGCNCHLQKPVDPDALQHLIASRPAHPEMNTMIELKRACPADGDVFDRAEAALRGHQYLALRRVSCEYRDGVLTLRGCLPSYYLKQLAQASVAGIQGVQRVRNEIAVSSGSPLPGPQRDYHERLGR
jgi:CheY-like chemotaxis protein